MDAANPTRRARLTPEEIEQIALMCRQHAETSAKAIAERYRISVRMVQTIAKGWRPKCMRTESVA